jgi:N6-adenosine-specific RNA methylase IME4
MSLSMIKALPVKDVAAKDCALLLWTISSLLPEVLEVARSWGLHPRRIRAMPTGDLWQTTDIPQRLAGHYEPRREHSRKPEEFYARVHALFPGPYAKSLASFTRNLNC